MGRASLAVAATVAACISTACGDDASSSEPTRATQEGTMNLIVASAAFEDGETVPQQYTCDGADVSPPLEVSGVPSEASELALIMEDPDAPGGTFVHWVLWGIGASVTSLPEGGVPDGAVHGSTDFGRNEYGGPCPPPGEPHRYIFNVYALSGTPDVEPGASADDLRAAFESLVLAEGSLIGLYGR
ncbi:MAG TPA: YbhB/YbcL family Raf kinase inhibitor-like protein [Jiangellaceae bacterium]